jgi:hypothetical protein
MQKCKIRQSTYKTQESTPQRATLPDNFLTCSITQNKQKFRLFATRVTTIAICQFLWQQFKLRRGPNDAVFPLAADS